MSSRPITVAILKQRLREYGLPTSGLKADLQSRLRSHLTVRSAAIQEMPVVQEASLQGLTHDVRRKIGKYVSRDLFYFSDQVAANKEIANVQGLKEGIYPDTLEWAVKNQAANRVRVATKTELVSKIKEIIALPNLDFLSMTRNHLTVRITVDQFEILRIQCLFFYPPKGQNGGYELLLEGFVRNGIILPGSKTPYSITDGILTRKYTTRWTPEQASFEDVRKALKDLMLGIHWVQSYVIKLALSPLSTYEDNMTFKVGNLSDDPIQHSRNVVEKKTLLNEFREHIEKVLPKQKRRMA